MTRIDLGAPLVDQVHQALTYAHSRGWLEFLYAVTPGWPASARYIVRTRQGVHRELRAEAALAYALGMADCSGDDGGVFADLMKGHPHHDQHPEGTAR